MNLHKALPCNKETGNTLLEVILVVALIGVLTSVVVPVSLRFYYTQVETETARTVLNTIRSAQLKAQYGLHNSNVGVKIFPSEIVMFVGDSYTLRTTEYDDVIPIEPSLILAGDDEVVFERKSGVPSTVASISFAHYVSTTTIEVSEVGLVDQQI